VNKNMPYLGLFDEKGKTRASLSVDKDKTGLLLYDDNIKIRAGLGVAKNGTVLGLLDENGKLFWKTPTKNGASIGDILK